MNVKSLLFICLCLPLFSFADTNHTNTLDENCTNLAQLSEIERLRERVSALEDELDAYKKVKPLTTNVMRPRPVKHIISKPESKGEKFVLTDRVPKKLTAYFTAVYQDIEALKSKLEENGFTVLATDEILKNKTVVSVTNDTLKNTSSFLSALHILVNKNNEIRVQNPRYFATAYLHDRYKPGDFNETLRSLENVLGDMYVSKEKFSREDLPDYNFMLGMPHFKDTITVGRGEDLPSKLTASGADRYISYVLPLPNGSILVGHKLKAETYSYLKKIDVGHNAQIFPYEVIIEEEKAYILAPKYYLALSLPLLSMTDFMKIASAPEMIIEDIKQAYK